MTMVPLTSADLNAGEAGWCATLCSDDCEFPGVSGGARRSSWGIVKRADSHGLCNMLGPGSYQVGHDTLSFVAGCAHPDAADHFGTKVLPHLKTCFLPHACGRVPSRTPATATRTGVRR